MYEIISKIELIGGVVIYTQLGHTSQSNADTINSAYDSGLGTWIETNKVDLETGATLVSTFFETTPIAYVARTEVSSVEGYIEITDITEMV